MATKPPTRYISQFRNYFDLRVFWARILTRNFARILLKSILKLKGFFTIFHMGKHPDFIIEDLGKPAMKNEGDLPLVTSLSEFWFSSHGKSRRVSSTIFGIESLVFQQRPPLWNLPIISHHKKPRVAPKGPRVALKPLMRWGTISGPFGDDQTSRQEGAENFFSTSTEHGTISSPYFVGYEITGSGKKKHTIPVWGKNNSLTPSHLLAWASNRHIWEKTRGSTNKTLGYNHR